MTVDLTEGELDVLVLVIESGCRIDGPISMGLRPTLLDALPKLRAALDAFGHKRYHVMKRDRGDGTYPIARARSDRPREYASYADADRVASYLNHRARQKGERTDLFRAHKWEVRFWVREIEP